MLSIILVNYRSSGYLLNCLRSIQQFDNINDYEILVVDNDSGDNSEILIRDAFPFVQWVPMGYNAGFARANNEGIRRSSGDTVLLLNPDTLVENDAIAAVYRLFGGSAYAACGIQLLNPDRTAQVSGNYTMKGGINHLLPLPYMGSFLRAIGNLLGVKKTNLPKATGLQEVDWINGAFLMVRLSAIQKAGMLDEDFFLFFEEAEWCSRLKRTGPLCIYGQFNVVHLQGDTSNEVFDSSGKGYYNLYDKKGLQIMVSSLLRIRKQFGSGWFLFHLLAYTITVPVFFILGILHNLARLKNPFAHFGKLGGFCKNLLKTYTLTPRMILGQPHFYKLL
ncbi:MAG: glycosyltransferase [Terrimonas sp.]|nr:glycosyltransferase [Terrimonas sp.]